MVTDRYRNSSRAHKLARGRMAKPPPPRVQLLDQRWGMPGIGCLSVRTPTATEVARVDSVWPGLRPQEHENTHWRWQAITESYAENLAIFDGERPLALWSSCSGGAFALHDGKFYVLDYLELNPLSRGGTFSALVFAVIASRALEHGAAGMLLASLPASKRFYQTLGGEQRPTKGWKVREKALIPFAFTLATLNRLRDQLDEYTVQSKEA